VYLNHLVSSVISVWLVAQVCLSLLFAFGTIACLYLALPSLHERVAVSNLNTATTLTTGKWFKTSEKTLLVRYDLRKFFFTNRVVNMWSCLPNSVVHAESTDIFKKWLDKFCSNREIIDNLSCRHSRYRKPNCNKLVIVVKFLILVLENWRDRQRGYMPAIIFLLHLRLIYFCICWHHGSKLPGRMCWRFKLQKAKSASQYKSSIYSPPSLGCLLLLI